MKLSQTLIPELKHEAATTRKMLERVPLNNPHWKPHEKSMALGRLATHVAELPSWITMTITTNELNFADWKYDPPQFKSSEELVAFFDQNVQKAIETLEGASNENLLENWTLRNGDHHIFTMPRIACIRSMAMNHMIHHRAQLSVYLRMNNVAIPGMYGPSADER